MARNSSNAKQRVEETSAGGFVLDAETLSHVALIGRETRSRRLEWCVPKGHPEGSETIEQAAIREVFEETGLEVSILSSLGTIEYQFSSGEKVISKTVHHFLMKQIGGTLSVENDPDHEAVTAKWVSLQDIESTLAHENERRMAKAVIAWVEQAA